MACSISDTHRGDWNQRLERYLDIGEISGGRVRARRDQGAPLNIIPHRVDAIERYYAPLSEIDDRKAARVDAAAHDGCIEADRQSDRLQLQVIRVQSEPRNRIIGLGHPGEGFGHGDGLVVGVLHGLQPDPRAVGLRERRTLLGQFGVVPIKAIVPVNPRWRSAIAACAPA